MAQWQDKMVRWQGGVEREATDIATKTRNGKEAVGINNSHREILTTNAAPKTESKNLEFNTKITFEEQELEPVIRKKLLNKVAQHKFNQDIYDASIISYKILHNYEDLIWLMKKFDIHHPLMDDGIDLLEKDPFYLKEVMSATLGVSMFYFSGNLAIPYSVLSNFLHKECGLVGSITTKVGEVLGYENLGAKYCNEVAGADLVISSILGGYAGYGLPFLIYSASNIAIRVSSIAAEHLLEQENR